MHPTAKANAKRFFDAYLREASDILEIGSLNINGTIRDVTPKCMRYVGADVAPGAGVDVVLADPYELPFGDGSFDAVLSSSTFEHSTMFWLLFLEAMRVLRPHGLFYLNAPSNGYFHRHPVDCWRFYPDAGTALAMWARRNGMNVVLLESYTSRQRDDIWNDFVAVFARDAKFILKHPHRIVPNFSDCDNILCYGSGDMVKTEVIPEDMRRARP